MNSRIIPLLFLAVCASALSAQGFLEIDGGQSSGPRTNLWPATTVVWSELIDVPGATALQVRFENVRLDSDLDAIIVTGITDGAVQRLNAESLKLWRNHTAWFNGSTVAVALELAPGSHGYLEIAGALADQPPVFQETICGTGDNRTVTTDVRVCRVVSSANLNCGLPGPCAASAFMISNTSTILTARHVAILNIFTIAEFNVPISQTSGAIVHPAPADQYPIDQASVQMSAASVVGDDWAVARLHPNANGDTAVSRQGTGFALAGSIPIPGTTIRITGFGIDNTPDGSRHHACQTHTGPFVIGVGNTLNYSVDTENGNSGSAVRNNVTGQVIGIHTNGGCTSTGGSNAGTSILNSGLQSAITAVSGCANANLSSGSPVVAVCTPTIYNFAPAVGKWSGVAVSSASDWDIGVETNPGSGTEVTSTFGAGTCDFVLANGHLGSVAPTSGRAFRFSGTSDARIEAHDATLVTVGASTGASWSSTRIFRLFEFNVTSSGSYDVTITGDSALGWRLYSPQTNANWRSRSGATSVASGAVSGGTAGVTLGTGWHAIAVFKNDGPASLPNIDLDILVCPGTTPVPVPINTPTAITNACQEFSLTPTAGTWNVVGISSPSAWSVALGGGYSSSSSDLDMVVANGNLGAISPTNGHFLRTSGTAEGTAMFRTSTALSVGSNSLMTINSGQNLIARHFNITSAGTYMVTLTGEAPANTFFRIFAPGSNSAWRPRGNAIASGAATGAAITENLATGVHLLVLYKNGAPVTDGFSMMANVCSATAATALTQNSVLALTTACEPYSITYDAGSFNLVAVNTDTAGSSDWDIGMGDAFSRNGGSITDYVLSNGNLGTPLTSGVASRFSGTGSGRLQHGFHVQLSLGIQYNAGWPANYVARVFEFDITTAGSYDVTLGGSNELGWRLHEPGTNPNWRGRSESVLASGTVGGATSTLSLAIGSYAIIVLRDGGAAASSLSFNLLVEPTPNPVPTITSLSPNAALAGTGTFNLTVNGASFVNGAVVRWNGAPLATNFVNSGQLTANVTSGLIAVGGLASVTVFNPAPGGGQSNGGTFTINNPVPTLTSLGVSSRPVGSAAFNLLINGSGFNSQTVARWNGNALPTIFVNSGTVSATISAALQSVATTANISCLNPLPGGGVTGNLSFQVTNPAPTITSLSQTSAVVGSGSVVLTVIGNNFVPSSVVRWNASNLATSFISANQLSAVIPPIFIEDLVNGNIRVFNPSPGGGLSTPVVFSKIAPLIASIAPTTMPLLTLVSPPQLITISGANFLPGTIAYANSTPLPTTFVNSSTVTCLVGPTVPQALLIGGIAIAVENSHLGWSNAKGLRVSVGNNQGTLVRHPLNPNPGETYAAFFEGGYPLAPLTMIIDVTNPAPVHPFPNAAGGYVLSVRPAAIGDPTWLALDGIGIYGPPIPLAFNATGTATFPGFVAPNPPVGVNLTVQAVFLDPTSAFGYHLTWGRFPDSL